jgi:hypothetical protein
MGRTSARRRLDSLTGAAYFVMTDAPEGLAIVYLHRLDEKMDRVLDGLGGHGRRITLFGNRLAALHGDFAG